MTAVLRPYSPEDFQTLYEMDQVCYPAGIAYSKRELRWFLRRPGALCLVACPETQIAGFILGEHAGRRGHIITLDVQPAWRRRRIGSALLAAMEGLLAGRGVTQVTLETATDNYPAIALWQKSGYCTVALRPGYYLGRIDALFMVKRLEADSDSGARR